VRGKADFHFNDMNDKKQKSSGTSKQPQRSPRRRGSAPAIKSEFDTKLLDLARVTRVRAGGRRFSFRATVIAGNRKGKIGVGVAKGSDVAQAMDKATRKAQKSMIALPIQGNTIPYMVTAKFGASRIMLKPQLTGRGLVAGGPARIICELAGIKDISAKFISKTHNKLNNALVTLEALKKLHVREKEAEKVDKKEEQKAEPVDTTTQASE